MGAGLMQRARKGAHVPPWVGPTAFLVLSGFFLGVVFWGFFFGEEIRVEYFDAGRADSFKISEVTAFTELDLYIVGLEDGRLRAIDGRVDSSDCRVRWLPGDERGRVHNPRSLPGVFEDPCTGATWSMIANAIQGSNEPLRTPHIAYRAGPDGQTTHAFVERVNP